MGQHLRPRRTAEGRARLRSDRRSSRSAKRSTSWRWCAPASASSPRSASIRCRRRSGNARCSRSRAIATSSATPAPGTSTTWKTCASRCASRRTPTTSPRSTTSSATTSTSAPTTASRYLYKNSANDGFHEAIGDTIALSVTPAYLVKIGLLDKEPPASSRHPRCCCATRSTRSPSCPFGILIDKWRWERVLRRDHAGELQQGLVGAAHEVSGHRAADSTRGEEFFDPGREVPRRRERAVRALLPGAHPPVPVPSRALQGRRVQAGPLNRCSIYGNKEAGERLDKMLAMGMSRALARRARSTHRPAGDGRDRDGRLLPPAARLARSTEQRQGVRLVSSCRLSVVGWWRFPPANYQLHTAY